VTNKDKAMLGITGGPHYTSVMLMLNSSVFPLDIIVHLHWLISVII